MWYHPTAFALGWRDVLAAWAICLALTAGLLGLCIAESEAEAELRAAAASLHRVAPSIQNHDRVSSG